MTRFAPTYRVIVLASILSLAASVASADTIYLKNGRVIKSDDVKIEGNKIVFTQYGARVAIPLALVDRVEEDDDSGPAPSPPPAVPARPPAAEGEGGEGAEGEDEPPAEQTREYWQERIATIMDEQAQLDDAIQLLRREERAFLFSHRSTTETRARITAAQERQQELSKELDTLRREARRLGVPPGWLRDAPRGASGS